MLITALLLATTSTTFAAQTQNYSITIQETYKEITIDELPQTVKDAVTKSYPDAKITKTAVSETNIFKIELTVGDQVATVYADAQGNFINQ